MHGRAAARAVGTDCGSGGHIVRGCGAGSQSLLRRRGPGHGRVEADRHGRARPAGSCDAKAQLADALTGAGIPDAALEVSESRTPTGLEADAIEAAVVRGKDCVVGQIRDGGVTVAILPVLASGKCFVGAGT
jgi:hypothetical protein